MSKDQITLKVDFEGDLRRISIKKDSQFEELKEKISELISLPLDSITFKYLDNEGDLISITSQPEFNEFIDLNGSASSSTSSLRLKVFRMSQENLSTFKSEEIHNSRQSSIESEFKPAQSESKSGLPFDSPSDDPKEQEQEDQGNPEGSKEEGGKEEETEEKFPSLNEIFESISSLENHIKEIFEQHPEISEQIDQIGNQFKLHIQGKIQKERKQREEFQRRFQENQRSHCKRFENGNLHSFPFRFPFGFQSPVNQRRNCGFEQSSPFPSSCGFQSEQQGHFQIIKEKLETLENMGFVDRRLNGLLLRKHQGNIHRVVAELAELQRTF